MIRRLYVHNFRCFQNFELSLANHSTVLLIGKNGSGKSTLFFAMEIFQAIARVHSAWDLLKVSDFHSRNAPMVFEMEAVLEGRNFSYALRLGNPELDQLVVIGEKLLVEGKTILDRNGSTVTLNFKNGVSTVSLSQDTLALPIFHGDGEETALFTKWLRRLVILRPIPQMIQGNSEKDTLEPTPYLENFGAWFSGLLSEYPAAYGTIQAYLKQVMPDLKTIRNPLHGKAQRSLEVEFSDNDQKLVVPFGDLSEGEKMFIICSVVLAAHDSYGPLVCFWDEPDSHLAISEVGHFILHLRKAFKSGQFVISSHDPEAIQKFTRENTFLLHRKSHLEPTKVHRLSEMTIPGELINSLIKGDLEP